jgi:hypothetical protein
MNQPIAIDDPRVGGLITVAVARAQVRFWEFFVNLIPQPEHAPYLWGSATSSVDPPYPGISR